MSDSDRQALRLAQDLREEMRAALPRLPAAPSVSPFVDQAGTPSVLLRMDADTARALMAVLAERRTDRTVPPAPEPRRADGSHVPPPVPPPGAPQAAPAPYQPIVAAAQFAQPDFAQPPYAESPFAEAPAVNPVFAGGTGPTPLVPSVYPTR
ncbi:hypothetical protein [Actinomadura opuntiae]|uniref:hypothetical protein n=1 Tax=Actinomadura sp. OS1-43 TaxID=604315 RepID=UPI00255AD8DA|nr:hypothetical protein [Actinomadura sp. OS1-43]MDL4813916.1 hypothetical protein [Actinomadura sp. OS1-43]